MNPIQKMQTDYFQQQSTDLAKLLAESAARVAELEAERDAVLYAARMPEDYEHGLPSWINQKLYAAYTGVRFSPEVVEQINQGRLVFPESPAHKRVAQLEAENAELREQNAAQFRQNAQDALEITELKESLAASKKSYSWALADAAKSANDLRNLKMRYVQMLGEVGESFDAEQLCPYDSGRQWLEYQIWWFLKHADETIGKHVNFLLSLPCTLGALTKEQQPSLSQLRRYVESLGWQHGGLEIGGEARFELEGHPALWLSIPISSECDCIQRRILGAIQACAKVKGVSELAVLLEMRAMEGEG